MMPMPVFTLLITNREGGTIPYHPIMRVIEIDIMRDGQMTTLGPFVMN